MAPFVYIYQHVPKCGGVSFVTTLRKWFPHAIHERVGSYPSAERVAEFAREPRLDLTSLTCDTLVHGHLVRDGIRPLERYGDLIAAGRCRLLTVVRDPLEHAISAYFHRQRKGMHVDTLEQWIKSRNNGIAQALVGNRREEWRKYLDTFFVVGVTEQLQRTIDILAAKIGLPTVTVDHLNISPRNSYEISESVLAAFRERNALGYEIHSYAVERLARESTHPA